MGLKECFTDSDKLTHAYIDNIHVVESAKSKTLCGKGISLKLDNRYLIGLMNNCRECSRIAFNALPTIKRWS